MTAWCLNTSNVSLETSSVNRKNSNNPQRITDFLLKYKISSDSCYAVITNYFPVERYFCLYSWETLPCMRCSLNVINIYDLVFPFQHFSAFPGLDNSYPRQLVPRTTRTQDNSYPRQLVPRTTRTQDNSYPRQLVPRTTRTQDNSYPRRLVPRTTRTHVVWYGALSFH